MQNILEFIYGKISLFTIALMFFVIFEFILLLILNAKFLKIKRTYEKVIGTLQKEDVFDLLQKILTEKEEIKNDINQIKIKVNAIEKEGKKAIKKVGIVRYNAFPDVGSDLSYSIAFLDEEDNGVVISGIYGRHETATFAKPIEKGYSKYPLSAEEVQAIERAKRKAL
jgi:exopolysaccharide biosynthesis protein